MVGGGVVVTVAAFRFVTLIINQDMKPFNKKKLSQGEPDFRVLRVLGVS